MIGAGLFVGVAVASAGEKVRTVAAALGDAKLRGIEKAINQRKSKAEIQAKIAKARKELRLARRAR